MDSPAWLIFWTVIASLLGAGLLLWVSSYIKQQRGPVYQNPEPPPGPPPTERTRTQRAVLRGQLAEQLAPLLPGFPHNPSDFRFLGQPIDFIVFDGLADAKDGETPHIKRIIIGDIKTGNARLSPHQEAIRRCVDEGNVTWETIRIDRGFHIEKEG